VTGVHRLPKTAHPTKLPAPTLPSYSPQLEATKKPVGSVD
jgi:hypothetical protein